jgi:homoserine dehydrogenase
MATTIALAGCGVVGGELARLIADRHNHDLSISAVLVRDKEKERNVPIPRSLFTNDVDEFLSCSADIIVEAIGGISPAEQIAHHALARGTRFITANKALLAHSGDTLLALARRNGAAIEFEAAVGGGVPVVRALRHSLRKVPVRRIRGILNGTSNYILSRIERGHSFDEALRAAQAGGFAEADSSRDLSGLDSADKIRVLAWAAYGVAPQSVHVECTGLLPDPQVLVHGAAREGRRVRLIATCERNERGVQAYVRPELVAPDSPFGRALDEQNVITLDLGWNQEITLAGPGAGGLPTATAILGDILCC